MLQESQQIIQDVKNFIAQFSNQNQLGQDYEDAFQALALKIFRFQFTYNKPFKRYCQMKRKTPLTVRSWQQIPAISIQAFKEFTLSCEPAESVQAVFMTSGTTNKEKRGRNYHPTLDVWDASMAPPFKQYVLPDVEKIKIFVLSPAEDINQNSSLSRYLTNAVNLFGTKESELFFTAEKGLDMEGLVQALQTSELQNEPVMLMGATFAYVHFLDYCKEHNLRFHLPVKSRMFDTGGFKGQSREVQMEELYQEFQTFFHVGRGSCINMYGMTELSSQIYDQVIRSQYEGKEMDVSKIGPPWLRTLVLHPDTLEIVKKGDVGVLAHYDLANWNSSLAILTEDLGYQTDHGFVLIGRAKGSEARGCSIAVDEILQANRK